MRALIRFIDEMPTPAVRVPSYNLAFLPHFQSMSEEAFRALADAKPLRREFLLKMGRSGFPEADMNEALERLRRAAVRMDDAIRQSGGPWLLGARITLADVAIMPVIVRMNDIRLAHLWSDLPAVARWFAAIQSRSRLPADLLRGLAPDREVSPPARATRPLSGIGPAASGGQRCDVRAAARSSAQVRRRHWAPVTAAWLFKEIIVTSSEDKHWFRKATTISR